MKRMLKFRLAVICSLLVFVSACEQVPITGRKQLNIVPESMINSMSFQSYSEFLSKNKLSSNTQQTAMVKSVGNRIKEAVQQYCAQNSMSDRLDGYKWEFNLIEDESVNAWAMPGGKVVVYTGLFKVAKDDTDLAVVVGHEIAHAIAQHGAERMSHGLLVEMGGMALSSALANKPQETQNLFLKSYGMGAQVGVLLPYSRVQETEADRLGLIFMAMAGYDPQQATSFWQRMSSSKEGGATPEFLSTHPSDQRRIEDIKKFIPEAMQYYH